ncbi:DoxX family protein [Deinococcus koreensis]|nr:DoxX family protein [Deinococcus koreensis]
MHVALWVAQILLAAAFGLSGFAKMTAPIEQLSTMLAWVTAVPEWLVRFIGVAEVAGALGLILPAATRLQPGLTPLAALGLTTIMVLALLFHLSRGEVQALGINVILGVLAAFVFWGRTRRMPISPRSTS